MSPSPALEEGNLLRGRNGNGRDTVCCKPSRSIQLSWPPLPRLSSHLTFMVFPLHLCCCCCSGMSDSLQLYRLQHARVPCPSLCPRVCSNSCPWVGDAIQPPHPLSFPSPPALNFSQHQGFFQWASYSHQMAKVKELQSFQWISRIDFL